MRDIQLLEWSQLPAAERQRILRRAETDIDALLPLAQSTIDAVREGGDAALVDYNRRYDAPQMTVGQLHAQPADFARAKEELQPELLPALRAATPYPPLP